METLEQAEHYIEVLYICAHVGFALWGVAGWVVGRKLQLKKYIKPKGLVNIQLMRQIEDDNFNKNEEITKLKEQIKRLEAENKKWKKKSHRTEADHL